MKIEKVIPWLDWGFILFGLAILVLSLLIRIDGRFFTVLGIGGGIFLLYLVIRAVIRKKIQKETAADQTEVHGTSQDNG